MIDSIFNGDACWIWCDSSSQCEDNNSGVSITAVFRRSFEVKERNALLTVHVSADSDYILYCNGQYVGRGPAMGNLSHQYYDSYDLSGFLNIGNNCLAAVVVGFSASWPNFHVGGAPMSRITATNGFILDGVLLEANSQVLPLHSSNSWKAARLNVLNFYAAEGVPAAGPGEHFYDDIRFSKWTFPAYCDCNWHNAIELEKGWRPDNVWNATLPYRLIPREIPFCRESEKEFNGVFDLKNISEALLVDMLENHVPITIPPDSAIEFSMYTNEETTAYPIINFFGGLCKIQIYYSEYLTSCDERIRDHRNPHEPITGPLFDKIEYNGNIDEWRPFFWRAFRYIRICLQTNNELTSFQLSKYIFTGYPYQWRGIFNSDNQLYNQYWEVGTRTLQLCSHDIFEDCPYYERLQYAADARIAALTSFVVSGDTMMAAQAIRHFRWSIQDEGLTAGSYPSRSPVLLPIWSLHWIEMVYDYYNYTGNVSVIKENLYGITRVVNWFLDRRDSSGLVGKLPYWCVGDWSPQWSWRGEPPGIKDQASAFVNFFVCDCLRKATVMASAVEDKVTADYLNSEFNILSGNSMKIFWNSEEELFADTAEHCSYSLLTNATAILAEIVNNEQAIRIIKNCSVCKHIAHASLFGKFFVFQALIKCGQFQPAQELFGEWKQLLSMGVATWPEGTSIPRSECHVWSSLPNYAIQSLLLGFKILVPGGTEIEISPKMIDFSEACGKIPLLKGDIEFELTKDEILLKIPSGIKLTLISGGAKNLFIGNGQWQQYRFINQPC